MKEEFISKFRHHEYISQYLYDYVKEHDSSVIPTGFKLDKYNNKILNKLYEENKEYFENMYKGIDDDIHLDEEQCKAILADEKYSLIIAGAGTGKTTTMVSKVKYLVDKKKAKPERILVMSYTRKATEEIARRIEEQFGLNVHVTTFHSLGFEYIREIYKNKKCTVMDRNKKNEILLKYFDKVYKDKDNITEILDNFGNVEDKKGFIFSKYFIDNYTSFDTIGEFNDSYIEKKIEEAKNIGIERLIDEWVHKQMIKDEGTMSIKGEIVKSLGEMFIANFLFKHGIDYSYEEVYEELMDNRSIYKPDFTIDYGGSKIYIEYYGLDDNNYNRIRNWKRKYHEKKNNKYIEVSRMSFKKLERILDEKLKSFGVKYNDRTPEEIYEHILRINPISQVYPFLSFLYDCVINRKESYHREDLNMAKRYVDSYDGNNKDMIETQYKYIMDFEQFYSREAYGGNILYFDFADLLYYSVKYIEKLTSSKKLKFDYIVIDEYQDISQIKYELTYKTAKKNDAKIYAVGDDWQSIYAFSGSRIEYIYRFREFFKGSKSFKITKTYRNSQELVDCSGEFIMRNDDQIKKQLVSNKHITNPIIFRYFDGTGDPQEAEIESLKETILEIHRNDPDHNILVLGRTNRIIDRIVKDEEFEDDIGSKITFKGYEDIQIDSMTMHKSKGLTYDEVIIIGLHRYFPSKEKVNFWYIDLYRNKPIKESIEYAEERRLFYVALTRTKNKVYLICNEDPKYRSGFVDELLDILDNNSV